MSGALWTATKIAMHLPGGPWVATLAREDLKHYALLERIDGLTLYLRISEGFAHVGTQEAPPFSRDVPDLHGFGILAHDAPRIKTSFNPQRAPKTVAKQIVRVVLEPYLKLWPEYRRRLKNTISNRDAMDEAMAEICSLLGLSPHPHFNSADSKRATFYNQDGASGLFEFSTYRGGSVKVSLDRLTLDDAKALAVWIKSRNKPLGVL